MRVLWCKLRCLLRVIHDCAVFDHRHSRFLLISQENLILLCGIAKMASSWCILYEFNQLHLSFLLSVLSNSNRFDSTQGAYDMVCFQWVERKKYIYTSTVLYSWVRKPFKSTLLWLYNGLCFQVSSHLHMRYCTRTVRMDTKIGLHADCASANPPDDDIYVIWTVHGPSQNLDGQSIL